MKMKKKREKEELEISATVYSIPLCFEFSGKARAPRFKGGCFKKICSARLLGVNRSAETTARSLACWTLRYQDLLDTEIAEPLHHCGTGIIFSPSHQPRQ